MGVKELRSAFNEVSSPAAACIKALLEYEPAGGMEWQVCYFSGNWADGVGFAIRSDRIRPGEEVNLVARATAERLLQQKGTI